jgi:HME family heavy-metal exporter
MIERAGKERLAPMLMTALTAGFALIPLVLAAGEPGKEILYPVATVILGGLISSTLLDFFVHPALFWCFGRRSAERQMLPDESDVLTEDPTTGVPAESFSPHATDRVADDSTTSSADEANGPERPRERKD